MRKHAFIIQLILASAVASAAAGMLVLFLILAEQLAASEPGAAALAGRLLFALFFTLFVGGLAILPAVTLATLPAFLAGAILWTLGRSRAWARRRSAFALAGAGLGGAARFLLARTDMTDDLVGLGPAALSGAATAGAFLLAGAASGLVFRAAMIIIGRFFGDDRESEAADGG